MVFLIATIMLCSLTYIIKLY